MLCPYCAHPETKVTDKRDTGRITRRRRECLKCSKRFSTHENIESTELKVIKKNSAREIFEREKIKRGVLRACEKRPVEEASIDAMIDMIEQKVRKKGATIKSSYIGELVSRELKKLDKVAYIRFASVYREFADISDFKKEIKELLKR